MDDALTVNNLSVELDGYTVLDDISFTVPDGSIAAIIGPNGAGKTVLIKCILKLLPKKSGEVSFFGVKHDNYRQVARMISYIPQYFDFDRAFPLTVSGLFSLKSSRPIGMNAADRQRMFDLLTMVGSTHLVNKKLGVLSGGQMQRIMLAYSLMDKPRILFLDEPAAGIDVQGQETIYPLLARIHKQEKINLVLVSHELQIVMNYANQVLCLNKKLLCSGIPRKALTNEILQRMYGTEVGHFMHERH